MPHSILAILCLFGLAAALPAQLFGQLETFVHGGSNVAGLALHDVNEDGLPDQIVLDVGSARIRVLLADGNGGFQLGPTSPTTGYFNPRLQHVLDMNGDGHSDIVLVGGWQNLRLFLGDGTGNFTAGPTIPNLSQRAFAGDINGDGAPDLAAVTGSNLVVSYNDGAGNFGPPIVVGASPSAFTRTLLADFTGDGNLDIFHGINQVFPAPNSVLVNDGVGGFTTVTSPSPNSVHGALCADLNGDRAADLIYLGNAAGPLVALSDRAGSFSSPQQMGGGRIDNGDVADVNGDGCLDVVGSGPSGTIVYLGDGTGQLLPEALIHDGWLRLVRVHDIDLDGRFDIVGLATQEVKLRRNVLPDPAGITAYGTGTPGCGGGIGIWATPAAQLFTPDFSILCSNVPPNTAGLMLLGRKPSFAGHDLLGIGALLHLQNGMVMRPMHSDDGRGARIVLPIPGVPFLPGGKLYAQSFWLAGAGDTCSPALFDVVTSRGLEVLLQ